MLLGILLIALGVGVFAYRPESMTALIPAFFGVVFLILGWLAQREARRKHAMHMAAGLALIGAIMAGYRAVPALLNVISGEQVERPWAVFSTTAMTLLCLVFLALCVRSFVATRRARMS